MSAYSTVNITRSAAKFALVNKIMSNINDEELEGLLDEMVLECKLYRCRIVNDDDENQNYLLN